MPVKDPVEALRNKRFGDRIKALLEERGRTQADLARALGKDASSISRYTRGEVFPKLSTRMRIAEILGVTVAYLEHGANGGGR